MTICKLLMYSHLHQMRLPALRWNQAHCQLRCFCASCLAVMLIAPCLQMYGPATHCVIICNKRTGDNIFCLQETKAKNNCGSCLSYTLCDCSSTEMLYTYIFILALHLGCTNWLQACGIDVLHFFGNFVINECKLGFDDVQIVP